MPWYKLYADHGPGHQSRTEEYMWLDKRPAPAIKREYWEEFVHRHDLEYPIGDVLVVKRLPATVREEKIKMHQAAIKYHERMVSILLLGAS